MQPPPPPPISAGGLDKPPPISWELFAVRFQEFNSIAADSGGGEKEEEEAGEGGECETARVMK